MSDETAETAPRAQRFSRQRNHVAEDRPVLDVHDLKKYFRLGGGSLKGVSKPGEIVWSRIYIADGRLKMDLGRAGVVELPPEETDRRWQATTPQWPIMHAVTYGVTRDQMMGRHKANHIQVAYADDAAAADRAMLAKASMAAGLGLDVHLCGTKKSGKGW